MYREVMSWCITPLLTYIVEFIRNLHAINRITLMNLSCHACHNLVRKLHHMHESFTHIYACYPCYHGYLNHMLTAWDQHIVPTKYKIVRLKTSTNGHLLKPVKLSKFHMQKS